MIRIALKMLVGDRLKYVALVAGLAFAALLVAQQASIFAGYAGRMTVWIRSNSTHDLWVMDPQVQFSDDIKPLSDTALHRVRGVEGVLWAVPMYKGFLTARLPDGSLETVRLLGIDDATLVGAPPVMVEGRLEDLRQDRAALVHAGQARTSLRLDATPPNERAPVGPGGRALRVGDEITVNDSSLRVVGTYDAPAEFFWDPVLITTYSRALSIAPRQRKLATYVLAKVAPGRDVREVATRIESTTGHRARTHAEFSAITMRFLLTRTGILINFGLTVALGVVVGVLASAQTFFSFIVENTRHFGALKAMGASNTVIGGMIFAQAAVVGAVGFGIGIGLASLTGLFAGEGALAFLMPWPIPVFSAVAIMGCCAFAGLISAARVFRLEPAAVFKA